MVDRAQPSRVLLPITVPLCREHARHLGDDLGRHDSLVARALERTFPEIRDREYAFACDLGEDSVQITLSAQPQQSPPPEATEAWELSLAAPANERAAALELNLDDVIREALDDVDHASFARALSR